MQLVSINQELLMSDDISKACEYVNHLPPMPYIVDVFLDMLSEGEFAKEIPIRVQSEMLMYVNRNLHI